MNRQALTLLGLLVGCSGVLAQDPALLIPPPETGIPSFDPNRALPPTPISWKAGPPPGPSSSDPNRPASPAPAAPAVLPETATPGGTAQVPPLQGVQEVFDQKAQELERLLAAQGQAQNAQDNEKLRKQIELLQKEIEVLQKMAILLGDQLRKSDRQIASLESRSLQAARRDQEVTGAIDDLRDAVDAPTRQDPWLPGPLKELFDASGNNESPLSIYGALSAFYQKFPHTKGAGEFGFGEFDPFFLLKLNDWILLEAEVVFSPTGADADQVQADFIINDWLTIVAGRWIAPISWFNERQDPAWMNKLPDFPLMFRQAAFDFSLNGLQARGSAYVAGSPVKVEYAVFTGNGVAIEDPTTLNGLTNLQNVADSSHGVNDAMAFGGRVGFWVPEVGVSGGVAAMFNRPYNNDPTVATGIELYDIYLNYHRGNWDFRFEADIMHQRTPALPPPDMSGDPPADKMWIRRRGLYAQLAYRPYDASNPILRNLECAARYSRVRFDGYDQTALDIGGFGSPLDAPVDRDQFTFGINYYVYPSLILKGAYQINREHNGMNLNDNVFLAQIAWGF
jgi:hypothetical protein